MEKLYGRLLVISQKRDITLENMLSYELANPPSSLFDDYGGLRKGAKSKLVQKLAVYSEVAVVPDMELVDGNEMLYQVERPKSVTDQIIFQNLFSCKMNTTIINSLPPTNPASAEHIICAHLKIMKWKSSHLLAKPDGDITMCYCRSGVPHPCTGVDKVVPTELMEVVACGCSSQSACSRNTCSSKAAGLSYTTIL